MNLGGIDYVADVMNHVDRGNEKQIFDEMDKDNPELSKSIRDKMFMFENIIDMDPRSVQRFIRDCDSKDRFIPVHTGQMNRTISFARAIQVHPRAYGVDMLLNLLVNVATGSSPCIRGGFIGSSVPNLEHRFIPVHTRRIHE